MKIVQVIAHAFDCLPGHVMIEGRGSGSTVRTAVIDGLRVVFADKRLHRKRIESFNLSVVVLTDGKKDR